MDTIDITDTEATASREDYWARMQALRADLARLRPPDARTPLGLRGG